MNETVSFIEPSLPLSKVAVGRQPEGGSLAETIHVLLVDDERLSRVVVGNLLRKCHYRGKSCPGLQVGIEPFARCSSSCSYAVTAVATGVEALEALRSNGAGTFQLVLTVSHVACAGFWPEQAVFTRFVSDRTS